MYTSIKDLLFDVDSKAPTGAGDGCGQASLSTSTVTWYIHIYSYICNHQDPDYGVYSKDK
jgi:hypothetical protein